jgi:hypothetical protein
MESEGRQSRRERPKRTFWQRTVRNVRLLYFRYEITMGAFLFEWWEKALIFLIFVGLLLLVSIAVYRLALGAVTHQRWHTRTTHAEIL